MKKNLLIALLTLIVGSFITEDAYAIFGWGKKKTDDKVIKVGATPVPHAEILEFIKKDIEEKGYKLEIKEFTDYVTPNLALNDGDIDANFFQHVPYMEKFAKDRGLDLISAGTVHVEPFGLYSEKYDKVEDLPRGATIAIPNDPSNGARALLLLEANGLIKLDPNAGLNATEFDVIENPYGLVFKALEAAQLPRVLRDVDAALINGNYALESGLNPVTDSMLLEGAESPYANIITVIGGNESSEKIKVLLETLQSEKVKNFILEKYNGGVVPAF
jgi:D-methionine transport system substrate-binding protein